MDVPAVLKRSARYAWTALAFLIISYALLVVIGRQLLPTLEHRQEQISQYLSAQLGIHIATEHISGSWTRLTPLLQVQHLSIASEDGAPSISINHLQSEFDILASLLNLELIWNDLSIGEVKLTLRENEQGNWFISNFPLTGRDNDTNNRGQLDLLADILLLSTHIGIEQVAIDVAFYDGTTARLFIDDIQLENNADFHRARANLSLNQSEDRAELIIEGRGDPKDWENFDGAAYIKLNRINLRNAFGIILRDWLPDSVLASIADTDTHLNAELWINALKPGHLGLMGKVQADAIPLNWSTELPPIKNLDTTFTAWFTSGQTWGVQCQNLRFDWSDQVIEPLNAGFEQGLGEHWNEVTLSADHINLATLKQTIVQTKIAGEAASQWLETLNPAGMLRGLSLSLDLEKTQPIIQLSSHIEQLSIDSWHHTPAARGLSGYLHWEDGRGYFDIDSGDDFAMLYPGVYSEFMHYGATQGRVNIDWMSADARLKIAGGPIDMRSAKGEIRAYISLDIPTTDSEREPEMFLQASIKNSHSRYLNNYLPTLLNPDLLSWLDRSIGNIDISEAGFIWRGSLKGDSHQQRTIQFYGQLANGDVDYDPGWPKLSQLSAQISIDDDQFEAQIHTALLGDETEQARLNKATIATRPGALLAIKADISAPLSTAVNTLLSSPLATRVSALKDWQIQGQTQATLDLLLPLTKNRVGESYRVEAKIDRGRMQLRDFQPINFTQLKGSIGYSDSKGLHSPGLSGKLWGQTLNATIATQGGQLQVTASGLLDLSKAPAWQPLFTNNVTGKTYYTAVFSAPGAHAPAELTLNTNLEGITIDLPAPLSKSAEQSWPLTSSLQFQPSGLVFKSSTDGLKAELRIKDHELNNVIVTLGDDSASKPNVAEYKGLLITGHTPLFKLDDWLAALQSGLNSSQSGNFPRFNTRAIVDIDHFIASGFSLDQLSVDAQNSEQQWNINIDSPRLAGNILVPEDSRKAIVARLNYLTLPKPELDSGQGLLNDLDPSTLPRLDFATEGLRIGDDELGSLAFVMQANELGVSIDQIEAEITGITFDDTPGGDSAQLHWRRIDGVHQSQFSAALLSDDLGAVLQVWNMPMILTTNRAAFLTDLRWQGKPWDISAHTVQGHIALNFEQGKFFQAPGTTTNALLKVVSLINFDTWLRRLKLDFSDLFSKGVHFDQLQGGLTFDQGEVHFEEPIVVTLPSGKLRLLGQTNLIEETIDARLIATLPVGTNLPWIVALIGGLPAAAGVYITSKLFEKQVNRISSISYKIKGAIDDPEIEVDRIFSDKID